VDLNREKREDAPSRSREKAEDPVPESVREKIQPTEADGEKKTFVEEGNASCT